MANVERIKNNLMWRGWSGLQAGRIADEIGRNLDNYLKVQEAQAKRIQAMTELYDNHTRYGSVQASRLAVKNAQL